jgi:hypothetical protein
MRGTGKSDCLLREEEAVAALGLAEAVRSDFRGAEPDTPARRSFTLEEVKKRARRQ